MKTIHAAGWIIAGGPVALLVGGVCMPGRCGAL